MHQQVFGGTHLNVLSGQLAAQSCSSYDFHVTIFDDSSFYFYKRSPPTSNLHFVQNQRAHANISRAAVMDGRCQTSARDKQFSLFYSEKERNAASNYFGRAMKAKQDGG